MFIFLLRIPASRDSKMTLELCKLFNEGSRQEICIADKLGSMNFTLWGI